MVLKTLYEYQIIKIISNDSVGFCRKTKKWDGTRDRVKAMQNEIGLEPV